MLSQWIDRSGRLLEKLLRYDFAVLTAVLVMVNGPYFNPAIVPIVDTLFDCHHFYFFYSEFFFNHHIGNWMPYISYGLPAFLDQMRCLTPMSYFTALAGFLLRIKDVLFLFKFSLLLDQAVFLLGLYLFSRAVFRRRSTTLLVCLGAIFSLTLHAAIGLNFRIFFMFPWAAYWLWRFFNEKQPEFLWLAGITTLIWWMGSGPYFICLWFFVLSLMCAVLTVRNGTAWRSLLTCSRRHFLFLAIFIALLCLDAIYLKRAFDFTLVTRAFRDPATGVNSLNIFLKYGGNTTVTMLLQRFIFGIPTHLPIGSNTDNNIYIGLIPLVFFGWALVRVRRSIYFAILLVALSLIFLTFGGLFARLVYYFPMMAFYRHIGLVASFAKIPILLCAGFGWDDFWSSGRKTKIYLTAALVGLYTAASLGLQLPKSGENYQFFYWRLAIYAAGIILVILPGWIGMKRMKAWILSNARRPRLARLVLLLAFTADLTLYQVTINHERAKLPPPMLAGLDCFLANPLPYQEVRAGGPTNQRQQHAFDLMMEPYQPYIYAQVYNLWQFDTCLPRTQGNDFIVTGIDRLMKSRSNLDPAFLRVLGCGVPKLKFISRAAFPPTLEDATRMMSQVKDLDRGAVLRAPEQPELSGRVMTPAGEASGTVQIKKFTANELSFNATVTTPEGAWLVYAEAFHPGWHAYVDQKEVPILEAYLGFKSIWIPNGPHSVRFVFRYGISSAISVFLAVFGSAVGFVFLILILGMIMKPEATGKLFCRRACP